MSRLTPSLLALDKGLDLQTAKIIAPEGSVFDTLNYEQVDFQGQKRIDGYTRYDGTVLPAINDYVIVSFTPSGCWSGFPDDTNTNLFVGEKLWAVAIKSANQDGDAAYAQILDHSMRVVPGDVLQVSSSSNIGTITSIVGGTEQGITVSEHYENVLELSANLRSRVTTLPEPIAGLHWFKDRLYAVAGAVKVKGLGFGSSWINSPITITNSGVTYSGTVVNVSNGEATLLTAYSPVVGDVITNTASGTQATINEILSSDCASFYESRSEQQALTEDGPNGVGGWTSKHLGWSVNFDRGIALYGELASVNQNRQNVGVEGPTSTSGTDGSPAVVIQKVNAVNAPAQVNGWKSYDSPTNYLIDAADVQQIDSAFIYADAFISWAADNSNVSISGSDMNNLVEYPPTNTIRYTT